MLIGSSSHYPVFSGFRAAVVRFTFVRNLADPVPAPLVDIPMYVMKTPRIGSFEAYRLGGIVSGNVIFVGAEPGDGFQVWECAGKTVPTRAEIRRVIWFLDRESGGGSGPGEILPFTAGWQAISFSTKVAEVVSGFIIGSIDGLRKGRIGVVSGCQGLGS